jgi:GT2 family glycosyltransferase
MDVSIVIVNWNTRDFLRGCLRSVFEQTSEVSFEVFVVDNASRDGSAEMVRTEFPSVRVIANVDNRGCAAANNQGIREASGRYVLLLNPDTIILDAAISRCVHFADTHPDVGIIGCQVLENDHRIQRTGSSFPSAWALFVIKSGLRRAFPRSHLFGWPDLGWWDRDTERDLDVIPGMFMLARRTAIEQVGLLDEAYFVFGEDPDWCYRFFRAGWRRVFTPSARIIHLDGGSKSVDQVSIKMFVQMQKSGIIYHRKNLGFVSAFMAKVIYIVSNSFWGAVWFVSSIVKRDPSNRHKAAAAALRFHLFGIEPK